MELAHFDNLVAELEVRLERLRSLYQQYFLGFEKMPPAVVHKDVERRFQVLRKVQIRNTARVFKFHTLIQRYNTYQQYWRRTCRQIEEGTYSRHLNRIERRKSDDAEQPSEVLPEQDFFSATSQAELGLSEMLDAGVDSEKALQQVMDELGPLSTSDSAAKPPPLPPRAQRHRPLPSMEGGPTPGRAPSPGLSDERIAELRRQLGHAKSQLNQDSAVSEEGLAKKLRATQEKLSKKHAGKVIDFKVVIKDGKAIVRPIVR